MTLSFPPRTTQQQILQETRNWNSRTAAATICFLGTCSSTYELSVQAPIVNGIKWVCQGYIAAQHPGARPNFAYFRVERLPRICKGFFEIATTSQLFQFASQSSQSTRRLAEAQCSFMFAFSAEGQHGRCKRRTWTGKPKRELGATSAIATLAVPALALQLISNGFA